MKRVKLFIVDYEQENLEQMKRVLFLQENYGIDVVGTASTFQDAFNHAELQHSDVVLLSAFLPDQMGIDLIPVIKSKNQHALILMKVTEATYGMEEISQERGADAILRFPRGTKKVIEKIREITGIETKKEQNKGDEKDNLQYIDEAQEHLSKWISDKMKTANVHETQILPQMIQELRELIRLKAELT